MQQWPEQNPDLLDDLIGGREDRLRDREPERLGRLEVDDELELGGLLDWQVGGLSALEDLVHVAGGATEDVSRVHPIGHQTPEFHHFPPGEAAWEPSPGGEAHDESSIDIGRWSPRDEERLGPCTADQREGLGVLTVVTPRACAAVRTLCPD